MIIRFRDGTEPLLTSCVPDLQLDHTVVLSDCSDFKINANGGYIVFDENVFSKSDK